MSIVSIVATIAESFFSNYMFQEFNTTESKSGALLSLAAGFYTIATLLSGVLGTQNKVSILGISHNLTMCYCCKTLGGAGNVPK